MACDVIQVVHNITNEGGKWKDYNGGGKQHRDFPPSNIYTRFMWLRTSIRSPQHNRMQSCPSGMRFRFWQPSTRSLLRVSRHMYYSSTSSCARTKGIEGDLVIQTLKLACHDFKCRTVKKTAHLRQLLLHLYKKCRPDNKQRILTKAKPVPAIYSDNRTPDSSKLPVHNSYSTACQGNTLTCSSCAYEYVWIPPLTG